MSAPNIRSFEPVVPMIYAYSHPDYTPHLGWTKIGYTEKQSVEERVKQQHHTSDIAYKILWQDNAIYKDGSGLPFTDHEFHHYLSTVAHVKRKPKTEWFQVDGPEARAYFDEFAARRPSAEESGLSYTLREEQERAVSQTADWFSHGGKQFLWNAKPRFGKTLSTYDLIVRMGFQRVLIVTNRPSIANSWAEDFNKFIGWQHDLCFVSDTDSLRGKPGVLTRDEYIKGRFDKGMVAFVSLQDLKGSIYFGGNHEKLGWMAKEYVDRATGEKKKGLAFDLLVVDEAQEGVETYKTEKAFDNIQHAHTLYLSGTPFKQLAGDQFSDREIFNWSYADEQDAKTRWEEEEYNPYESLPQLLMYTYQLGPMIYDTLSRGIVLEDEDEAVDPAFDLNEFFLTDDNGKFLHRDDIKKFLMMLFKGEKYPFSTPELRKELSHTMWYLNRVASAKALHKLMREDEELKPLFDEYEIVLAAGDGRLTEEEETKRSYDKVKEAIAAHEKTITLTVGQLTVGVTIPEWSGVFMLCNMQSPSSYMQAAFRAQNPYRFQGADGRRYRKERAYLFDFDPARTLIIYDQFANNLIRETATGGTTEDREKNIKRLLNFFPVLGEDDEGRMVELDAAQVLTIPRKLKSAEVVRHGFMSNFLFANISGIFGAAGFVREIIEKLTPAHEEGGKSDKDKLDAISTVKVDDEGNAVPDEDIVIGKTQELFGDKIYETIPADVEKAVSTVAESKPDEVERHVKALTDSVKGKVAQEIIAPIADSYGMTQKAKKRMEEQAGKEIEVAMSRAKDDFDQQKRIAQAALDAKRKSAETEQEVKKAESEFAADMQDALKALTQTVTETVQKTLQEKPKELVERLEQKKEEDKKKTVEDEIRAHLRGFARTIPSFIMAYGDENLTLANFDDYTEDAVFLEVTGISEEEFRFLRDGGNKLNPETGLIEHFDGHLFDEGVFNDSIREFLRKRAELADYFDESKTEDIFDYIPPQKTNQIFTPKRIVKMMVDKLEEENPGCFDDPNKTFADLYMKSGLYVTEIVKRLYRSETIKAAYPDGKARIRHILQHQVYGMAPTRIIYLIATNYILGFDEELKAETHHFVQADAAEASKNGTLKELVDRCFG